MSMQRCWFKRKEKRSIIAHKGRTVSSNELHDWYWIWTSSKWNDEIKWGWPRHDLLFSLKPRKVIQSVKLLNIHIQQCTFGKQGKDKNNEAFIPETASGNSNEWEESEKITSQEKKNTDKERENEGEGARRGGEIRVTLCHSGTCSAYKLKEKPKVCHWVISLLSTSWGLGLDSDHVPAESAGPCCSQNSARHSSRIFWQTPFNADSEK